VSRCVKQRGPDPRVCPITLDLTRPVAKNPHGVLTGVDRTRVGGASGRWAPSPVSALLARARARANATLVRSVSLLTQARNVLTIEIEHVEFKGTIRGRTGPTRRCRPNVGCVRSVSPVKPTIDQRLVKVLGFCK
jgi:hypothetical protein